MNANFGIVINKINNSTAYYASGNVNIRPKSRDNRENMSLWSQQQRQQQLSTNLLPDVLP